MCVAHFVGPFLKEWAVLLQLVGISAMSPSVGNATGTSARHASSSSRPDLPARGPFDARPAGHDRRSDFRYGRVCAAPYAPTIGDRWEASSRCSGSIRAVRHRRTGRRRSFARRGSVRRRMSWEYLCRLPSCWVGEAQRLFHEQHIADPDEGLPEGFLRVGIELANGRRISNLQDRRHLWGQPDQEPEGPVLMQSGGGGGSAGSGHVTMNPAYWLWPLPPSGTLHLFVEWPSLGIALSSADLDGQRDRRCGFELTTALERPRQKSRSPLTFQSSGFDHTTISRDPGAVNRVHDFRRHRRLGPRGPVAFPPI